MATQGTETRICAGCGARLAHDLRYCVNCYRPVGGAAEARAHVKSAGEVNTTHRVDPTVIFLPDEHERLARRSRRRKRSIIAGAIVFVFAVAGLVAWNQLNRSWAEQKRATAREEAARQDLKMLSDALERFKTDIGRYPRNEEGIGSLTRKPAAFFPDQAARMGEWYGPYLDRVCEVDPWGNDYVYQTADGGASYELLSHGPGGETGSRSQFHVASPSQAKPE
jgi:general secretion pathway protein G